MAITSRFLVVKDNNTREIRYFDYDKLDGYKLKGKKDIKFIDAINIDRMIIINPSFIDKIATRKINTKFEKLIKMMQLVCEVGDDDPSGETYRLALDEADKLKRELINKYRKLISEEKLELMLKKIGILEDELNLRLTILLRSIAYEEELGMGHAR